MNLLPTDTVRDVPDIPRGCGGEPNSPMFYVKSVDGMGSATLKAFQFQEIPVNALTAPQVQQAPVGDYVTREEFNNLLARLGEKPSEKEESHE